MTNSDCFDFLYELKWGNGFKCRKCNNTTSRTGKTAYHKRCLHCDYEESVTAHTIFHHMRFPILKGFYMVYRIRQTNGNISALKLMTEVFMSTKTVSRFKKTIVDTLDAQHMQLNPGKVTPENFLEGLV